MRTKLTLPGAFLLLATVAPAEIQVGSGAVQVETSLTGVYDSNLSGAADGASDYYLNFHPVLHYRRPGGRFATDAHAGVRIKRYHDRTESDSEDADIRFDWNMARAGEDTTGAKLSFGYQENTDAAPDVNRLVRTKNFFATTSGEVLLARRSLLSAALAYRDSRHSIGSDQKLSSQRIGYDYVGFTDGTTLGVDFFHQAGESKSSLTGDPVLDQTSETISAKASRPIYAGLKGAITYGYRWLDRGEREALLGLMDESGGFYGASLEGSFLPQRYFPKTTGTFRIAYEQAATPGLNDFSRERLVGEINVAWAARETTSVRFFARRSQDLSIDDNTVVNESTGLTLSQQLGNFVRSEFALLYTNADFANLGRTDQRYEARAGASYRINRTWSSGMNYSFLHSTSNFSVANYDRHLVSGNVSYAF